MPPASDAGDPWHRGYVLAHCFAWDTTQHVSAAKVTAAGPPATTNRKDGAPPTVQTRRLCEA